MTLINIDQTTYINRIIFFTAFDPNQNGILLYTQYNFNYIQYVNDAKLNKVRHIEWYDPKYPLNMDILSDPGVIFLNFINYNQLLFGYGLVYDPWNGNNPNTEYNFICDNRYYSLSYRVHPLLTSYFDTSIQTLNKITNYIDKYGFVLHCNYMETIKPSSNIKQSQLSLNQFKMIEYTDDEIRRIQDYYFTITKTNNQTNYYTKYNFNFSTYSIAFNTYNSKLAIFTDFIVRCVMLSGTSLKTYGYNLVLPSDFINSSNPLNLDFSIYFDTSDNEKLIQYMINNAITSDYKNVLRNIHNIDYINYSTMNTDVNMMYHNDIKLLTEHYMRYGQFEQRIVPIFSEPISYINTLISSVGTVFTKLSDESTEIGTAFLYNAVNSNIYDHNDPISTNQPDLFGLPYIYLITCYHINESNANINTLYATFETINPNNILPTSVTACFKIIGYDIFADILVGLYDPTLTYNIVNGVNMLSFKLLTISFEQKLTPLDQIYTIGNLELENNKSFLTGTIIDSEYSGNFDNFTISNPNTLLIELFGAKGMSGAPIFYKTQNNAYEVIGMINGYISLMKQYTIAISGFTLNNIVNSIIQKWNLFSEIYFTNPNILTYHIKNGYTKKWLGIIGSYFNKATAGKIDPALNSLTYVGGMIVKDFILGFNFATKSYITNAIELSQQNIVQINTPLLTSNIYKTFINNGHIPLVIKSLTYYDGIQFGKYYLGKYSNQVSYAKMTYGYIPIGNEKINGYVSEFKQLYANIIIEYYWFDGIKWNLSNETIGGNNSENYNTYIDPLGYKYYQHQMEFPFILIPYLRPFIHQMKFDDNSNHTSLNMYNFHSNNHSGPYTSSFFSNNNSGPYKPYKPQLN